MNAILPVLQGAYPPSAEFIPAIVVGILFGAALEVSGFGNAKNLAGQFYFHDMRVLKVMFTAIITAAAGVAVLTSTGLLRMELIYVPDTFLIPHLVGGFVLGVGFMLSAYCPGTSIVSAASGKWDGLVTVFGVIAGSALFGELYPHIRGFYDSTAEGVLTFPKLFHLPFPVLVAVLIVAAFLAFLGTDKIEGLFAGKLSMPQGAKMTTGGKRALGALFSLGILAIIFQYTLAPRLSQVPPREVGSITAVDLARALIEEPRSLYVVDIRNASAVAAKEIIPQSIRFADIEGNVDAMYKGKTMVVYSEDGKDDLPSEITKYKGRLVVLSGGYEAWRSEIMGQPEQTYQAALRTMDSEEQKVVAAIHGSFTGAKIEAPSESAVKPAVTIMAPKKRGGGCS